MFKKIKILNFRPLSKLSTYINLNLYVKTLQIEFFTINDINCLNGK